MEPEADIDTSASKMNAMLDAAVTAFQQQWGQKVREQREAVAAMGMPDFNALAQMLPLVGISLSPEELTQLEEGTFTRIDLRLLLAVFMTLEVGVDALMISALQQSASRQQET